MYDCGTENIFLIRSNNKQSQIFDRLQDEKKIFSRFQSFCGVCLWVSLAATSYAFGIFSQTLRYNLNYSQQSLDIIASCGNSGLYLSFFVGISIEYYGYKSVILFGSSCLFIGFVYIYLVVIKIIPSNMATVTLFYCISQIGACCFIASAVTVSVKLFPSEARGTVLGLCKGYFGLSSATLGVLATGLFNSHHELFILFIAIVPPMLGIIGASMSNLLPPELLTFDYEHSKGIRTSLDRFVIHWSLLFVVVLVIGLLQNYDTVGFSADDELLSSILVIIVMLSIVFVPSSYGSRVVRVSNSTTATISPPSLNADYHTINESSHLIPPHAMMKLKPPSSSTIITTSEVVMKNDYSQYIDMPIAKSITTWQLWSLFFVYMIGSGTSLMVFYNINAITVATRQRPSSFFVSLIGLSNGLGRLMAGLVSDYIVQHNILTRLQFYSLILLSIAITQLGLSAGIGFMLFPCFLGVGFLFGSSTCLIAVNVTDIFGQQYVATNFGFVDSAPILGSYVFATLVVNAFYRDNDISPYDDLPICTGAVCFQYAFYFNAVNCFVACLLCYYIHLHRNSIKVDQS